jgi:hypothetical protein
MGAACSAHGRYKRYVHIFNRKIYGKKLVARARSTWEGNNVKCNADWVQLAEDR